MMLKVSSNACVISFAVVDGEAWEMMKFDMVFGGESDRSLGMFVFL